MRLRQSVVDDTADDVVCHLQGGCAPRQGQVDGHERARSCGAVAHREAHFLDGRKRLRLRAPADGHQPGVADLSHQALAVTFGHGEHLAAGVQHCHRDRVAPPSAALFVLRAGECNPGVGDVYLDLHLPHELAEVGALSVEGVDLDRTGGESHYVIAVVRLEQQPAGIPPYGRIQGGVGARGVANHESLEGHQRGRLRCSRLFSFLAVAGAPLHAGATAQVAERRVARSCTARDSSRAPDVRRSSTHAEFIPAAFLRLSNYVGILSCSVEHRSFTSSAGRDRPVGRRGTERLRSSAGPWPELLHGRSRVGPGLLAGRGERWNGRARAGSVG